ncbi:putative large exoprotein involved in heme utilization or adhesion [Roseibium sp. TrichSKD4]|nr:putative large exoprotein involved in heme utilization or adhesion [Roseibium sp. TrichSKD4]
MPRESYYNTFDGGITVRDLATGQERTYYPNQGNGGQINDAAQQKPFFESAFGSALSGFGETAAQLAEKLSTQGGPTYGEALALKHAETAALGGMKTAGKAMGAFGTGFDLAVRYNDKDGITVVDAAAVSAGVGTAAAVGFAVGGPFGAGIGAVAGFFASSSVDALGQKLQQPHYLNPFPHNHPLREATINPSTAYVPFNKCFPSDTSILTLSGSSSISSIVPADIVLSFDPFANDGRGALVPKRVVRTFTNITEEWLRLSWVENGEERELVTTPGHEFLSAHGGFRQIEQLVAGGRGTLVLSDGSEVEVASERLIYSAETADMFEQAEGYVYPENGNLALKPEWKKGWKTYNFEVEDFHTYVAGGVRVHNDSYNDGKGFEYSGFEAGVDNAHYKLASGRVVEANGDVFVAHQLSSGWGSASPSGKATSAAFERAVAGASTNDVIGAAHSELEAQGIDTNSQIGFAHLSASVMRGTKQAKASGLTPNDTDTGSSGKSGGGSGGESPVTAPPPSSGSNSSSGSSSSGSSGKSGGGGGSSASSGGSSGSSSSSSGSSGKSGGGGGREDSGSSGGGGGGGKPILMDLDDNGIQLTEQHNSTVYLDIGEDGYEHRTAWVATGDGVLIIDADGDNQISDRKEVIFTDWDPSADTDAQALRQIFDTNNNGMLDAGDDRWSEFKVMVTNPDGTITAKTLTELGIVSINLDVDQTRIEYSDGSSIDGESTFTRSDGSTGRAATATLAYDTAGYSVEETATTDAAGNTVTVQELHNKAGELAAIYTRTTSPDGQTIETEFDYDADGVVDRVLTDVTTTNADGSRVRTETNRDGGGTLLDRTVATTSADQSTVTIDRDQLGGGFVTQREIQQKNADNSFSVTLENLAPDGTVLSRNEDVHSQDRLTRTNNSDADGNSVTERSSVHQTVKNADGSRVETDSVSGGDGSLLNSREVVISADQKMRTESIDLDGDGVVDAVTTSTTSSVTGGATATTISNAAGNGTVYSTSKTTVSSDGRTTSVENDIDGDGTVDQTETEQSVIGLDGSETRTVTRGSEDGTKLFEETDFRMADGLVGTREVDQNGDGAIDKRVEVSKNSLGIVTEEAVYLNRDGSLASKSLSVTSDDGLITTTKLDRFGQGAFDQVLKEITIKNLDGSATEISEARSASGQLFSRTVTDTSADGMQVTVETDLDGDGLIDQSRSSVRTLHVDDAQTEVQEIRSGDGSLLSQVTTTTSADRRTISEAQDGDGDGLTDSSKLVTTASDGSRTVDVQETSNTGVLLARTTQTTSGNGLTTTVSNDYDGDGDVDLTTTDATVLNLNGSTTRTVSNTAQNGSLLSMETTRTSGNGLEVSVETDIDGDGDVDHTVSTGISTSSDGMSVTETGVLKGTTLVSKTVRSSSADGLQETVTTDVDGNGVVDRSTTTVQQFNANGSTTVQTTTHSANGTLIGSSTTTTDAHGLVSTTMVDRDGNGVNDVVQQSETLLDGTVRQTVEEQGPTGQLLSKSITEVSDNGLTTTQTVDTDGDGLVDFTRSAVLSVADNGDEVTVLSRLDASSQLVEQETRTVSADGLSSTATYEDGQGNTLRSRSQTVTLNQDGSKDTETQFRKSDGSLESSTVTSNSGNGRLVTTTTDIDGDGIADQYSETRRMDDGSLQQSFVEYTDDGVGVARQKSVVESANGLTTTTTYTVAGSGEDQVQVMQNTVLNNDGGQTTTKEVSTRPGDSGSAGTWSLAGQEVHTVSGNGLVESYSWDENGDGQTDRSLARTTSYSTNGDTVYSETLSSGSTLERSYQETTSANGLSISRQIDLDGNGVVDQTSQETSLLGADGSVTRSVVSTDANGVNLSTVSSHTSADQRTTLLTESSNVQGYDTRITEITTRDRADGGSVDTAVIRNLTDTVLGSTTTTISDDERQTLIERDVDGDGDIDQVEQRSVSIDGSVTSVVSDYSDTGALLSQLTIVESADNRTVTTETDSNGDGIVDTSREKTISRNGDGSLNVEITETNLNKGGVRSTSSSYTSADGRIYEEERDVNNDGTADKVIARTTLISGAVVTTVENNEAARNEGQIDFGEIYWNDQIAAKMETTKTADGRFETTQSDYDGDGYYEVSIQTTFNIDGSTKSQITETNTGGAVVATGLLSTSHDGMLKVLQKDANNDGVFEHVETSETLSSGETDKTTVITDANGVLQTTSHVVSDQFGNTLESSTIDANGQLLTEQVRQVDGTSIRTNYSATSGIVTSIETLDRFGVLSEATLFDADNAQDWSTVQLTLNSVGFKTLEVQFLDSGTGVHVATYADQEETGLYGNLSYLSGGVTGTSGADYLLGGAGADLLTGNAGNDVLDAGGSTSGTTQILRGGSGDDVYVYKKDSGIVLIDAAAETASSGSADKVVFADLDFADLTIDYFGNSLRFSWSHTDRSGELRIDNLGQHIEKFEFADGTVFGRLELLPGVGAEVKGTGHNDFILGTEADEIIYGLAGSDHINARGGNDTVYADSSDIWFGGGDGIDTLIYQGTDNFEYSMTSGSFEIMKAGSGNNKIWGSETDNDIDGEAGNDHIQAGGGDDIVRGGAGADILQGQAGNDIIYGGLDDDAFLWSKGDGNDTISSEEILYGHGIDTLYLNDVLSDEIQVERLDEHIIITVTETGEKINLLYSYRLLGHLSPQTHNLPVDFIEFADGEKWSFYDLQKLAIVRGQEGGDTIFGTYYAETFIAGSGDDIIFPNGGDDFIDGGLGYDTAIFDGAFSDYTVINTGGMDYSISHTPSGSAYSVQNVEKFVIGGQEYLANTAPSAGDVVLGAFEEDTPFTITAAHLLENSNDVDGENLSISEVSIDPEIGTVTKADEGSWIISPAQDLNGSNFELSFSVSDGRDEANAVARFSVTPENDAPCVDNSLDDVLFDIERPFSYELPENTFSDVDGDELSFSAVLSDGSELPSWISIDSETGVFSGLPPVGFAGMLDISVIASDGMQSAQTPLKLEIRDINNAPVVSGALDLGTLEKNAALTVTAAQLLQNISDIEGEALSISQVSVDEAVGVIHDNNDGSWTLIPADTPTSSDLDVTYSVSDGTNSVSATAKIELISPDNQAPTIDPGKIFINSGSSIIYRPNVEDSDGDHVTVELTSAPQHGEWEIPVDNWLWYQPSEGFEGTDSFSLKVTDIFGASFEQHFAIHVGKSAFEVAAGEYTSNGNDVVLIQADEGLVLNGLDGDDVLKNLGQGGSVLNGGSGDDWLHGNTGNDTYKFGLGFGNDVIQSLSYPRDYEGDVLELDIGHLSIDDVVFSKKPTGLRIELSDTDSVTIIDYFEHENLSIVLSDGTPVVVPNLDVSAETSENEITGDDDDNSIVGTDEADVIRGLGGWDYLQGGDGDDELYGGDDDDDIDGGAGADLIFGGSEDDFVFGEGGNDLIYGETGDDYLSGDEGDDTIYGGEGYDYLTGGDGADYMDGGLGDDYLTGGAGSDTFHFKAVEAGSDVISDFSADDVISLEGFGIDTFEVLMTKVEVVNSNTLITVSDTQSISLNGIDPTQLQQDDFQFL